MYRDCTAARSAPATRLIRHRNPSGPRMATRCTSGTHRRSHRMRARPRFLAASRAPTDLSRWQWRVPRRGRERFALVCTVILHKVCSAVEASDGRTVKRFSQIACAGRSHGINDNFGRHIHRRWTRADSNHQCSAERLRAHHQSAPARRRSVAAGATGRARAGIDPLWSAGDRRWPGAPLPGIVRGVDRTGASLGRVFARSPVDRGRLVHDHAGTPG